MHWQSNSTFDFTLNAVDNLDKKRQLFGSELIRLLGDLPNASPPIQSYRVAFSSLLAGSLPS
jgi:hypothetical protein